MKTIKPAIVFFAVLILLVLLSITSVYYIKIPSTSISTKLLFVALFTFNVIAFITLIFFVGKNLFYLYIEAKNKAPGYRFKSRLIAVFVILTLIPSGFLFITASGLATNYINQIFSPTVKEPFKKSIELAKEFYDYEKQKTLELAYLYAQGKILELPTDSKVSVLTTLPDDACNAVKDAFKGKSSAEVISQDKGDIIIGATSSPKGIVVVQKTMPAAISTKSLQIKSLYEDMLKLEAFKSPLNINFVLTLGFATMLMVFAGIWVSLKLSKSITVPIENLAKATLEVSKGNLDVSVPVTSKDEIGLLTQSFNDMVTQLRQSKESLQKAYSDSATKRLLLENILQNINSGVIVLDNVGKVITMNKSAMNTFALTSEDLADMDYQRLVQIAQSPELQDLVKSMQGKYLKATSQEITLNIKGRRLIAEIYIVGIRQSDDAKAEGILVVLNDITEAVRAQKIIAWQEVARRMAHEIKNPLTPIKLSAERALKKFKDKAPDFEAVIEKSFNTIVRETEILKNLVDEFARYGRLPELQKTPTDLNALIEDVISIYKGYKDVHFELHLEQSMSLIDLDPEQIRRAIINIIDNALRAMNNKGTLVINTIKHPDKYLIKIADTGCGISDDIKDKLFLPYFSKSKDGTGLGLAITHRIIKEHRGNVYVLDNSPQGAIFVIELPC